MAGPEWGSRRPFPRVEGWPAFEVQHTDQRELFQVPTPRGLETREGRLRGVSVTLAHWLPATAAAALPAWRGARWSWRRHVRRRAAAPDTTATVPRS